MASRPSYEAHVVVIAASSKSWAVIAPMVETQMSGISVLVPEDSAPNGDSSGGLTVHSLRGGDTATGSNGQSRAQVDDTIRSADMVVMVVTDDAEQWAPLDPLARLAREHGSLVAGLLINRTGHGGEILASLRAAADMLVVVKDAKLGLELFDVLRGGAYRTPGATAGQTG